jgi:hypothetical protein
MTLSHDYCSYIEHYCTLGVGLIYTSGSRHNIINCARAACFCNSGWGYMRGRNFLEVIEHEDKSDSAINIRLVYSRLNIIASSI